MAEVFRRVMMERVHKGPYEEPTIVSHAKVVVKQENANYIVVKEVNFDDNGLKDSAFACILAALATQPSLKRISYVNNEIGAKSIA